MMEIKKMATNRMRLESVCYIICVYGDEGC